MTPATPLLTATEARELPAYIRGVLYAFMEPTDPRFAAILGRVEQAVATLDRDRAARDAFPAERLAELLREGMRASHGPEGPKEFGEDVHEWLARYVIDRLAASPSRALDVGALERILPAALAEADTEGSDADDWLGSEYVMRLAEAILAALAASPSPEPRIDQHDVEHAGTPCGDCDGVGWVEGGEALQTECGRCRGTGPEPDDA